LLFVVSFTLVPVDAVGKKQLEEQTGVSLEALDEIEGNPEAKKEDYDDGDVD
jgi:hypothetical protein